MGGDDIKVAERSEPLDPYSGTRGIVREAKMAEAQAAVREREQAEINARLLAATKSLQQNA